MPSGGGPVGRFLLRALAATAVALGGAWPAGGAVAAGETGDAADVESGFVSRVGEERRERGLPELAVAGDLVTVARRHSARMAAENRVFHNAGLPDQVAGWEVLGENVGAGPDVDDLHRSFMASDTHRREILRPGFTAVGVGVVRDGDTLWVTQVFRAPMGSTAVVEHRPRPAPVPRSPRRAAAGAARPAPAATTTTAAPPTTAATTTTAVTVPLPPAVVAMPLGGGGGTPAPAGVPGAGVLAAALLLVVVAGAATSVGSAGRPAAG